MFSRAWGFGADDAAQAAKSIFGLDSSSNHFIFVHTLEI